MSADCQELVEILTQLSRRLLALEDQRDENHVRGLDEKNRRLYAKYRQVRSAMGALIRWIARRTGIATPDLWEAAFRAGTAAGLAAWESPEEDGITTTYRDLLWILPKLHELSLEPTTRPSLIQLARDYPALAKVAVPENADQATAKDAQGKGGKRGWTQPEVDAAIRQYITAKSTELTRLGKAISAGKPKAIGEARKVFGRNALARRLGCPAAMVSKSRPWKAVAGELSLSGRTPGVGRGDKVGFDKALEDAGVVAWKELAREQKAELEAEDSAYRRHYRRDP